MNPAIIARLSRGKATMEAAERVYAKEIGIHEAATAAGVEVRAVVAALYIKEHGTAGEVESIRSGRQTLARVKSKIKQRVTGKNSRAYRERNKVPDPSEMVDRIYRILDIVDQALAGADNVCTDNFTDEFKQEANDKISSSIKDLAKLRRRIGKPNVQQDRLQNDRGEESLSGMAPNSKAA